MSYPYRIIIAITVALLALHLAIINDYGLTWDFHYHFFSGANFFGRAPESIEKRQLPYGTPDPRICTELPYGPIVQNLPTLSYIVFFEKLKWLADDAAYNLPLIFFGVFGIMMLGIFMYQAFGIIPALFSMIAMALMPRYFSDLHNNMKDAPMAAIFTLNIWMLFQMMKSKGRSQALWVLASAIGFALAFNTKVNAIFIPVIAGAYIFIHALTKKISWKQCFTLFSVYCFLSLGLAFGLWSLFWKDPLAELKLMFETFGIGTNNIEVLMAGTWFCSGKNVPFYYPWWYIAITTPIPTLLLSITGILTAIIIIIKSLKRSYTIYHIPYTSYTLPLLWLILPLTRYLLPNVGVIDGVRHFEEVLFAVSALVGIGAHTLFMLLARVTEAEGVPTNESTQHKAAGILQKTLALIRRWEGQRKAGPAHIVSIILIAYCLLLTVQIVKFHPFQITYFNELVGGVKGAYGHYDLDYWGGSQKKAVEWLNANAEQNAKVHIAMAGDVAARYLRPDLMDNYTWVTLADYVVILNRQGFFYRYGFVPEYVLSHDPIHTISVDGVPLVWIYDNRIPAHALSKPWWHGDDPCIIKRWTLPPPP